jgi:hypothetical protein
MSVLALAMLAAGCAAHRADVAREGSDATSAVPVAAREVSGTWRGSYWQVGMVYYLDDAHCTVLINDDQTFSAKCERSPFGSNNLARSSSWSGHVVMNAGRAVLRPDGGPWPSIVLNRHGRDTLYGVTLDPRVGATIQMRLERAPSGSA